MSPQIETTQSNCKDIVSKVIDKVLRQVFGEDATRIIYRYLEEKYSVRSNEIGEKIELFAKGLEEFLKSGAYIIEQKILEDIYSSSKVLHKLERRQLKGHDFVSQVRLFMSKT
ncbi:MAG: hypothetical protein QXW82_02190 [Candidatus Bathyarchaeia archaeon]